MRWNFISIIAAGAIVSAVIPGCGHYPKPIKSARSIKWGSSSEYMVVIVGLSLKDWPKLQKFRGLEHLRILEKMAPEITDDHVLTLSKLHLPKLRQVSLAHCTNVTDNGIQSLTNFPSIRGLQLIGLSITDRGMKTIATAFPRLNGINVEGCPLLTTNGILCLTNSSTITSLTLSVDPFSPEQIETLIPLVPNVTWWTIGDPHHRLNHPTLRELGLSRKIVIQVIDDRGWVTGITHPHEVWPAGRP
jgi:hypothetical protein